MKFTRTLEIKQLSVPAADVSAVQDLYRLVERDERSVIVLKRQP